jgi:hypothetical protein
MTTTNQNYSILDFMDYHCECGFNTAQANDASGQSNKKAITEIIPIIT